MSSAPNQHGPDHLDLLIGYALQVLPSSDVSVVGENLSSCADCRRELETLRPIVESFVSWPTDLLRPLASLWDRLAQRIATETGGEPIAARTPQWTQPEWKEVAPGISCMLLATDTETDRVTMLVRLAPGVDYPPHRHAGVEELYLLDGELVINDKTLHPGDYNRAEAGSADRLVRSETGCTCVLMTSAGDELR
jgi:quercetin dioxygenase-like cupin family protein